MGGFISRYVKGAFNLATKNVYRFFALQPRITRPDVTLENVDTHPEEMPLTATAAPLILDEHELSVPNATHPHTTLENVNTTPEASAVVVSAPPAPEEHESSQLIVDDAHTRLEQVITPVLPAETDEVGGGRIKKMWDKYGEHLVEGSSKVLEIVKDLASDIPLVGTVLDPVLKGLGALKVNFSNFKEAEDIVGLLRRILDYLGPSLDGGMSMRARKSVLTFEGDLRACVTRLVEFYQHTKLMKVVKAEKLTKELADIRRGIDSAIQMLTMAGVLGLELELMRKVQDVKDEASKRLAVEEIGLLRHLHPVEAAHWSFESVVEPCLTGTRIDVIREILAWAEDASGPQVLWLTGQFGTGKSAVAKSVCKILDERDQLASSFFAQRSAEGVSTGSGQLSRVISTLSYYLGMTHPEFRRAVLQALIKNPGLPYADTSLQAMELLSVPFQESGCPPGVIVIDGLNDLPREDNVAGGHLIQQLQSCCPSHIKLLLCGSGNHGVHGQITTLNAEERRTYDLQHAPKAVVAQDVRRVYTDYLGAPPVRSRVSSISWPPQNDIDTLVNYTGPLFAFAAAAKQYISHSRYSPASRLQDFIRNITDANADHGHFDMLYRLILEDAVMEEDSTGRKIVSDLCLRVHNVLAGVILAQEPIDLGALALISEISDAELELDIIQLSPILCYSADFKDDIRVFHVSFQDYVFSMSRCFEKALVILSDIEHMRIANRCFQFMNTTFNPSAEDAVLKSPAGLRYACLYAWSHLALSSAFRAESHSTDLETSITTFCNSHLSRWLHELGALGALSIGMDQVQAALKFLREAAKRGVGTSQEIVANCIRQLKVASASSSGIAASTRHELSVVTHQLPQFTSSFGAHKGSVISLAGSATGLLTSSGSGDTVHAWPEGPLPGLDPVILPPKTSERNRSRRLQSPPQPTTFALAFTPDGASLVSGFDNTLQVRESVLQGPSQVLYERNHHVVAIAVAGDDDHVAFVSGGLRLWSRSSKERIWHAKGYKSPITTISISSNNKYIAAGSSDHTIAIMRFANGDVRHRLFEHTGPVRAVACSPRQAFQLASASDDRTVRIWNGEGGVQLNVCIGHTAEVMALAWTTYSNHVLSGAKDGTVRMWDPQTGHQLFLMSGIPTAILSLTTFPVGDRVAIGCEDGSIHTWRWDCEVEGGNDVVLIAAVPLRPLFAACTRQGVVYVIDIYTGDTVQVIVSAKARALDAPPVELHSNNEGTALTVAFIDGTSLTANLDPNVQQHSTLTQTIDNTLGFILGYDGWLRCVQGASSSPSGIPVCWIPPAHRLRQEAVQPLAVSGTRVAIGGTGGALTVLDCSKHEIYRDRS